MRSEKEITTEIEVDQMMYAFPDLLEELKQSRLYLETILGQVDDDLFFWIPEHRRTVSIAQHIGHIACFQKEEGKKADVTFSFRMDLFDDFFSDPGARIQSGQLPSRQEIMGLYHEIHDTFLDEVRFNKKSEMLFTLINHVYAHAHEVLLNLKLGGQPVSLDPPASNRVSVKKDLDEIPLFHLPVYAN